MSTYTVTPGTSVPSNALEAVKQYLQNGGSVYVPTYTRCTYIDGKVWEKWERVGRQVLQEDGKGYRMGRGRSSVYLFPGQLTWGQ